jgi:carbamate kinase
MKKAAVEKLDKQEAEKEAKKRAAENKYFEDKRVKPSPLVVEAELAKMKEILNKPKGSSGGGGGGIPSDKMDKMKKMNYKAGGKVSSASKRADGCAIRGKTRA